ncbi:MAG: sulfatase [Gemmatimonadaceae bacterium]
MKHTRGTMEIRVLSVAAGMAIVTGALQVAIGALRHAVGHDFIWVSRDYVWMTPLGTLALFLVLAAPVSVGAILIPRWPWIRISGFLFGTLGVLSLVLLVPGLHHLAALAMAVGAGTRVAMWFTQTPERRVQQLQRVTAVLVLVLAAAAGWREWARRRAEKTHVAALPVAAAGAPNVLVIILDTVRAASMSFLGYGRETTPALAALGAEGAVFEQAWTTSPWTLPSHAGMFTGRFPSQLSTDWRQPLDDRHRTLAEILAGRGYRTAGFAANHFYTSYESGLTRGFDHYEDYLRTPKQVLLSATLTQTRLFWQLLQGTGIGSRLGALARMDLRLQLMWTSHRKLAPQVTGEFLRWQETVTDRPFFAFLNLYDAHLPYDPPAPWDTRFSAERTGLDKYDGGIAYMDDALGSLFAELRRRGLLDRTLVVVSSDHGEGFGEHGLHGHGNSLYRTELHVPLVVRYPDTIPPGTRVSAPVTLRDLAATALDAAGAGPGTHAIPGASWLRMLALEGPPQGSAVVSEVSAGINTDPTHPVSRGAMQSLVTDSIHYIRNGDGVEEAYAWRTDPGETKDRAKESTDAPLLQSLRDALLRALR